MAVSAVAVAVTVSAGSKSAVAVAVCGLLEPASPASTPASEPEMTEIISSERARQISDKLDTGVPEQSSALPLPLFTDSAAIGRLPSEPADSSASAQCSVTTDF